MFLFLEMKWKNFRNYLNISAGIKKKDKEDFEDEWGCFKLQYYKFY